MGEKSRPGGWSYTPVPSLYTRYGPCYPLQPAARATCSACGAPLSIGSWPFCRPDHPEDHER